MHNISNGSSVIHEPNDMLPKIYSSIRVPSTSKNYNGNKSSREGFLPAI
jgi:hypothetical protein